MCSLAILHALHHDYGLELCIPLMHFYDISYRSLELVNDSPVIIIFHCTL